LDRFAIDPSAGPHVALFLFKVDERYQQSVDAVSERFAARQDDVGGAALLLAVRQAAVYEKAETMIPGAQWRDPAQVSAWAADLPADRDVIVYCVYGHEVGRTTALRLRSAGVKARFLHGGIDGWKSASRPLAQKR